MGRCSVKVVWQPAEWSGNVFAYGKTPRTISRGVLMDRPAGDRLLTVNLR